MKKKIQPSGSSLPIVGTVEANAAGIDVGARQVYAAVPPDRDPQPVRSFDTFTEDLEKLADWLLACGIRSVAMESTGVYWIPVFDILERQRTARVPGQCASCEARSRTQERCARLPVVAVPALGRAAARLLPPR